MKQEKNKKRWKYSYKASSQPRKKHITREANGWTKGIPQQDGWYWLKDSNPNKACHGWVGS